MKFTKMHGLGNNYIIFNLLTSSMEEQDLTSLAKAVSDVNFGIGSDGMILICPSERADFRMRIFNKDGSEGKNCGNGLRCVAKYLFDRNLATTNSFSIETLGGVVGVMVTSSQEKATEFITIDMGEPKLLKGMIPMQGDPSTTTIHEPYFIGGKEYHLTCVSMGNPHAILFVENVNEISLEEIGPVFEHAELFPERVNLGIIHVINDHEIDYRVWERGSGITMACGTGACAAVVAASLNEKVEKYQHIKVHLPGGDLEITWDENNHIWKKGTAEYICHGEIEVVGI